MNARERSIRRISVFALVISLVIGAMGLWAVWVQGIDASGAAAQALARLKTKPQTISATRGTITDRSGVVLAQTLPYVRIIADPYGIVTNGIARSTKLSQSQKDKAAAAPKAIADILMSYLGGSDDDYLGHLTCATRANGQPNQYEPVAANVPAYTWAKIQTDLRAGGWYGLSTESTPLRIYPDGTLVSNVLGFVGADGDGLDGVEQSQNANLKGVDGQSSYEASTYGRIPMGDTTLVPPVDGDSYQLTIDATIQAAAQQEVVKQVGATGSDFGIAIVMDIKTGEVLAMANAPTFDGNNFSSASQANIGNRAIRSAYEPGSVQKVLTMAALIDQGLITPDTKVEIPSSIKSGANTVYDSWRHGTLYLTARGVLTYSSNIGTLLLARKSDPQALTTYLASFGLGQPTGIQLPGEASGQLNMDPPGYQRDRMAFGQSISVTAIQEAAAIAGVTNGGIYHQPTIIKSVTDAAGNPVPQPALISKRVVSEQTSAAVVNMMQSVTESSVYGKTRLIPDYSWGGKTGTAQRYDAATGGYRGTTASFVGIGPTSDPQFLVYVVMDNPTGGASGAEAAFPVARDLMMVTLSHYGVPPSPPAPYTDLISYKP
ncbi:MAG: penicillin-binding protein 2 [Propionibacteriaceae bacterium]|nr:penicillin-binding protein 2 [Propionibacteriaceae bacterium]